MDPGRVIWDFIRKDIIMAIKLVKGDFNSLEEALLAQIKLMQDRIEELEKWEKHCYHCGRHWEECCHE